MCIFRDSVIVKYVEIIYYFCSIAKPEDVQYFQFDSDGNMYVYEPGAGCTGAVRKVAPGDELDLLSNDNNNSTQKYDLIPPSNVTTLTVSDVHHDSSVVSDSKCRKISKTRY